MTDLEKAVANALRLSDEAATDERMLATIQRNIRTARAELIRSGLAENVANEDGNVLVEDAIITFCMARMGDEGEADRYENIFKYQQENLRKS